jgi:hypothetical protein
MPIHFLHSLSLKKRNLITYERKHLMHSLLTSNRIEYPYDLRLEKHVIAVLIPFA